MSKKVKGIILAGGLGTRLYPLTKITSKQLLPVYDKPMIYYPLSILLLSNVSEIAIVTQRQYLKDFKLLLGNGEKLGIKIKYYVQNKPNGIPEAYKITKKFIKNSISILILGDNIFYGDSLISKQIMPSLIKGKNTIYAYPVSNPSQFGVVSLDNKGNIKSIDEKPKNPKSNLAITGLYIFDENVSKFSSSLKYSKRGETEIIDLIKIYKSKNKLNIEQLGRGVAWLDTGSHKNLNEAGQFIQTIENRQGMKIACIEEIAYKMGYISKNKFKNNIKEMPNSKYKDYLSKII